MIHGIIVAIVYVVVALSTIGIVMVIVGEFFGGCGSRPFSEGVPPVPEWAKDILGVEDDGDET